MGFNFFWAFSVQSQEIIGGVEWKWCRGSTVADGDVENLLFLEGKLDLE